MKKCLRLLFLLALFTALLCAAALAAEPTEGGIYEVTPVAGVTVEVQDADETAIEPSTVEIDSVSVTDYYAGAVRLQVTLSGASDGYWLVLAQSDSDVPSENNIKYIDQSSASDGTVSFNVYPSDLQKGTYYIYLVSTVGRGDPVVTFKYHQPYRLGDVDDAEGISVNDALFVLQAVAKTRTLTGAKLLAANVDGVEGISVNDALFILQAVAKTRTLG